MHNPHKPTQFIKRPIDDTSDNNHPLHNYPFVFTQTVAWGDIDAFNHLNNVKYYEYSQSARIDFMQAFDLFGQDTHTVIVSTACDFLASVFFGDTLSIGVRVKKIGTTSLTQEYAFYSNNEQKIVAKASSVMVQISTKTGDKQPWHDNQIQTLEKLL